MQLLYWDRIQLKLANDTSQQKSVGRLDTIIFKRKLSSRQEGYVYGIQLKILII